MIVVQYHIHDSAQRGARLQKLTRNATQQRKEQTEAMSQNPLQFPVHEFSQIMKACRADEPLEPNDPRFVDLTSLRDGDSV